MIYAVIDTNVLVSSLLTKNNKSATARLAEALVDNKFCPLYNEEIVTEYREVLSRKEFAFKQNVIDGVIDRILKNGLSLNRTSSDEAFNDPTDAVFYEVALSKEGAYVVTGNLRHFPSTPIVVTPAEMVKILEDANLIERL